METPPAIGPNFKQLSTSQFYIELPDEVIWQYRGAVYGWWRLGSLLDIIDLQSQVNANNLIYSDPIAPTAVDGTVSSVQLPVEMAGVFIEAVVVQGMDYSIGSTLNEPDKVATYNAGTRIVTLPSPLWSSINVWHKGISGGSTTSTERIVSTPEEMEAQAIGNREITFFLMVETAYSDIGDNFVYYPILGTGYAALRYLGFIENYKE